MKTETAKTTETSGWVLKTVEECASTNDIARNLPLWHAVVAQRQSAGRGRFGRRWESGEGGLWLSAVVPAPIDNPASRLMPLAAGYAVSTAMREYGIFGIRLRWPNDVMVREHKCAGILVDRFHLDRCVVGMGVNVFNDPSLSDAGLKGQVTRLMDLVKNCPPVAEVARKILKHLECIVLTMELDGADELVRRLESFWKIPTRVRVTINAKDLEYNFWGVDREGRVLLKSDQGQIQWHPAENISLLREI